MSSLQIGIIDTGINPWHSHVRGHVDGCRIYLDDDGRIREGDDYSDPLGHGTAIAGVIREALPNAGLFAIRVFDHERSTYPSLLARAILRACAAGCDLINLSLALPPVDAATRVAQACEAALENGVVLVAAGHPEKPGLLPASLPGVHGVIADDSLDVDEVVLNGPGAYHCHARGRPRDLPAIPSECNLSGHSLACARVTACLAKKL